MRERMRRDGWKKAVMGGAAAGSTGVARVRRIAALGGVLLLAAATVAGQAPPPQHGGFRILGPGGGGTLFNPAISPLDPQTMLASCDMSGGYITHDGGQSWRMFNLRGEPRQFVFDPVDPRVMYAVGIGLWKSTDRGDTWAVVAPAPGSVRGISDSSDEADVSIISNDSYSLSDGTFPAPTAVAIDPLNHEHLYGAFGAQLLSSRDGGLHWSAEGSLPSTVSEMTVVRKAGDKNPRLLMAGSKGMWASRGGAVQSLVELQEPTYFSDIRMDAIDGRVLVLAVVGQGRLMQTWIDLWAKSPGTPWKDLPLPGTGGQVTLAVSGHDGKTIYASYSDLQMEDKVWEGVAKSDDLGAHWTLELKDSGKGTPNFRGSWIETEFGDDWGDKPVGLTVSSKDPALIFATNEGGVLKSTDGGAHWSSAYSHTAPDGGAATNGIDVLTSYGTFFDPFAAQRMFVGYVDIGLMRSENRGESWWPASTGIPHDWINTTYWMVFDPEERGRVWAAKSGTHDLPRARMWRNNEVSNFNGGVVVSDDGGRQWVVAGHLPNGAVTHLLLDPHSPARSRTLYAAVFGHGVYKSVDGGRSWSQKSTGIVLHEPKVWRLALAADGTLYAVIARGAPRAAPGDSHAGALYRSRDGAATWERVALPAGVSGPTDLAIDPSQPARLYLSAWAREAGVRGSGGGLFVSDDAGASWKPVFERDQHVASVTIDPGNPNHLYAVGFESSAWRSNDRGASWTRIAGYNFKAGLRVTSDPAHAGMVYINTFGGGVWYGPVDGPPGVEDISTRQIAP